MLRILLFIFILPEFCIAAGSDFVSELPPDQRQHLQAWMAQSDGALVRAVSLRLQYQYERSDLSAMATTIAVLPQLQTPDVLRWPRLAPLKVAAALTDFVQNSAPTMRHLTGFTQREMAKVGKSVIVTGQHTIAGYEDLLRQRLQDVSSRSAEARAEIQAVRDEIDLRLSQGHWTHLLEELREFGFTATAEGMLLHLSLGIADRWSILRRSNGVLSVWNDRWMFKKSAWEGTRGAAVLGLAPVGGKTLFPREWDESRIAAAVELVLRSSESQIVTENVKLQRMFVGGLAFDVHILVGVDRARVATVFPRWRQEFPSTLAAAYMLWAPLYARVVENNRRMRMRLKVNMPMTVAQAEDLYLGRPILLQPQEQVAVEWLNPEVSSEILWLKTGLNDDLIRTKKALQHNIFDFHEMEMLVQQMESYLRSCAGLLIK